MKTIKTDTHYLLVDETSDKIPDDYVVVISGVGFPINSIHKNDEFHTFNNKHCAKIIAASPKLGDLPEFEELPLTEDNVVENLAKELLKNEGFINSIESHASGNKTTVNMMVKFYKQAKSETGFSLEDIMIWYQYVKTHTVNEAFDHLKKVKSLAKPKEYEFVPEMEAYKINGMIDEASLYRLKIINNKIQGIWKLKS